MKTIRPHFPHFLSTIICVLLCWGCEDIMKPPGTPLITYLEVSDITVSSANCTFTIEPVGAARKAGVIYGTDPELLSDVSESFTATVDDGNISLTLSPLYFDTEYYYKAYLSDKYNSSIYSEISQFRTNPVIINTSKSSIAALFQAGSYKFDITSNVSWSIVSNQEWCTVQPATGDGDREITVFVTENASETPRTATLTITAGNQSRQVKVEQDIDHTTLDVSATTINALHAAGQHTLTITSNAAWTIASDREWCTVQPASGEGNRDITVTVTANTTETQRTATLTVTAGRLSKQVKVEQDIDHTTLEVSVTTINAPNTASQQVFTITSNAEWTITSDREWCTVQPTSGNENREITVSVTENNTGAPRTAMLTITSGNQYKQVKVEQNIDNTTLDVSVSTINAPYTAGEHTFTIISNAAWTIVSDREWCTVQPASGNGNRIITVSVTNNTTEATRTATLTVSAGNQSKQVRVEQNMDNTTLYVSVTIINAPYTAGQHMFTITSNTAWTIVSDQNWCTVQPPSGSGNREITVSVTNNPTESPRSATLTVSAGNQSKQVRVIQDIDDSILDNTILEVSVNTIFVPYAGTAGQHAFTITSNAAWTIDSNQDWCTVQPASGSGNRIIAVYVTENSSSTLRKAALTVTAGNRAKQVNIEQEAQDPKLFNDNIVAAESFGGGMGTQSSPYLISNAHQLKKFVEEVNNGNSAYYYRLTTDIQVTAAIWIPIGNAITNIFKGDFVGDGHTISGSLRTYTYECFGFFGFTGGNARISNLKIDATIFNGGHYTSQQTGQLTAAYTGALVGCTSLEGNTVISNCRITGTVTGGNINSEGSICTGGIVGRGNNAFIQNCEVNATITGGIGIVGDRSMTGGIIGAAFINSIISDCVTSGNITGSGTLSNTGGIVGSLAMNSSIDNCTNQASVTGGGTEQSLTGGIAGDCDSSSEINNSTMTSSGSITEGQGGNNSGTGGITGQGGNITNCTNNASLSGMQAVGGITGRNEDGKIHTSLNKGNVNGISITGGLAGYNNGNIYSCCTNMGNVNNVSASTNNQIGLGKAVETCTVGHTKR